MNTNSLVAHAEFCDGVGCVRREPFLLHVERRRQREDMRIRGTREMRDRVFRHHEGPARIDLMHQVEALHLGRLARRQADRARIVDDDVEASEGRDRLVERGLDGLLVTDVDL